MGWQTVAPDETKSVSANKAILQDNTDYTKDEMNKDHYWNIGADEDGRHKWMNTVATNIAAPAVATNAPLETGMNLLYYSRLKTAGESPSHQDCQPFVKNLGPLAEATPWDKGILQLLGIRAMCIFNAPLGVKTEIYAHNCTVTRDGEGRYTANFTEDLPTTNYAFLGGGIPWMIPANTSDVLAVNIEANSNLALVKDVSWVKFRTILITGKGTGAEPMAKNTRDPVQAYFIVFGG